MPIGSQLLAQIVHRSTTNQLRTIFVALLLWLTSAVTAFALENIPLYQVTLTPYADGTVDVTEVVYYDFARSYKHGITRTIPYVLPSDWSSTFYRQRYFDLAITSVTMDDEPIHYESTDDGEALFLKIGDPYQTVTTEHKFTIDYTLTGVLQSFQAGPTELYWNAIGTDSAVPVLRAEVFIADPDGIATGQAACYRGGLGSSDFCETSASSSFPFAYTTSDLEPYEGMSVALSVDPNAVSVTPLERVIKAYFIIPAALLALFGLIVGLYRYKTAHKTGRPIIAQYEPYDGLKPMYLGMLIDDRLDPSDITACIVYLAQQGYLKIKKTERKVMFFFEVDDYAITLLKIPDASLTGFQRDVLKLLFTKEVVGEQVTLNKLKGSTTKQRENQRILDELRSDLKEELIAAGYFQNLNWQAARPFLALLIGVVGISMFAFLPLGIFFIILLCIFYLSSRRRTRKGYEALDHLKGFKDFLSVTEKERYKFHNAPQSPEQFMQFLPYAIAFGVEEEWAEVFKDVTIPAPEWYDSGSVGSFSATNLTNSLGAFSTAFAASSGSTGGAGSSGGGSVGGGGGGGSVGSW